MNVGLRFIRWGLGRLVFGIFIGFGPTSHYIVGAQYPTGDMFMRNVTLSFACPWLSPSMSCRVAHLFQHEASQRTEDVPIPATCKPRDFIPKK
jgi:hypothetical protein